MLAPTGPATSAASDRSGTHQRRRKGSCGDGNSSEAEAEWHEGSLQTLRHAAPVRAPFANPRAHGHCRPEAASSERVEVREGSRRGRAHGDFWRHGRARQLILAGGLAGGVWRAPGLLLRATGPGGGCHEARGRAGGRTRRTYLGSAGRALTAAGSAAAAGCCRLVLPGRLNRFFFCLPCCALPERGTAGGRAARLWVSSHRPARRSASHHLG